jgi:hypothetical protein
MQNVNIATYIENVYTFDHGLVILDAFVEMWFFRKYAILIEDLRLLFNSELGVSEIAVVYFEP